MDRAHRISLNGVRVFAIAVRMGSLSAAAVTLGVTAGAVSHQIRKLEDEIGVSLFRRQSNSIALTDAGQRFHSEIALALATIEQSLEALFRDENEISVRASTSLALRWLIPALDRFRARCPDARVSIDTGRAGNPVSATQSDIVIRYFRPDEDNRGWQLLMRDMRRPVASPRLLSNSDRPIQDLPLLQCTPDNRDWAVWCAAFGLALSELSTPYAFDTDDAALHACVAGLGVVLAPAALTLNELHSGALVELPGYEQAVDCGQYRYHRQSDIKLARQFCRWMEEEMQAIDQKLLQ